MLSRRAQNGSDAETQQPAIEPLRIDARNGPQRLNWKQAAPRREADLTQTVAEMAHEVRETTAQTVALLLIDGERPLRRADDGEGGRAESELCVALSSSNFAISSALPARTASGAPKPFARELPIINSGPSTPCQAGVPAPPRP